MPYRPDVDNSIYICRSCFCCTLGIIGGAFFLTLFSEFWNMSSAIGVVVLLLSGVISGFLYFKHLNAKEEFAELVRIILPLNVPKHEIRPPSSD